MKKQNDDIQLGIHVHGNITLQSATFNALPPTDIEQNMVVSDEISYSNVSLKGFTLTYTRRAYLNPKSFFEVSVVYTSTVVFDDDAGVKILQTQERVQKWIEGNAVRIVNTFYLPGRASLLISNMSSAAGFEPIISQPSFIANKQ